MIGSVEEIQVLRGTIQKQKALTGTMVKQQSLIGKSAICVSGEYGFYFGEYEITPTREEQVIQTQNLILSENFKINPIPQNYGLITWNGSVLTVS